MATKKKTEETTEKKKSAKTNSKAKAPAKAAKVAKVAKAPKTTVKAVGGPLAKLKAAYGSKESLVGKIVEPLAGKDEDTDALKERLLHASNKQLLRLAKVVETVTQKYGSRDKLIAAIGKTMNKAKDADYLAKLETLGLAKLFDLARSAERRA
ncbi:MAG TPA: hypothetical protein VL463_25875 [Kofleriaceae bacterium]|jgi:hypothetical protein|nr:hypothetical protein [Kofleriaceae bacterium]